MGLEFYSPMPQNAGAALFVTFNSKDQNLYLGLVKQTSYDQANHKGGFKNGDRINVKLSKEEAGSFLYAIATRGETSFYHKFNDNVTSGQFTYYEKGEKKGFGLSVKNGEVVYKVGFTLGGGLLLSEYIKFALDRMFQAIYAEDKKKYEELAKKSKEIPDKSDGAELSKEPIGSDDPAF
jgi:hypothetical protein